MKSIFKFNLPKLSLLKLSFPLAILFCISTTNFGGTVDSQEKATEKSTASRNFEFNYGGSVVDQTPGANIKVWFPIPADGPFQKIELVAAKTPGKMQTNTGQQYGNKIGFFETTVPDSGKIQFSIQYRVTRMEAKKHSESINDATRQKFLSKNTLVPISGKPLELIKDTKLDSNSFQAGHQLYDVVQQYMAYDKSKPGYGNGDVLWACNSKTGNCTDFHSLFISLARSQGLPAKFEIGFPLPSDKSEGKLKGYHCWAWFHASDTGWVPVDISEADKHPELEKYYFGKLTPDRITFSTGRDIRMSPPSTVKELNYFVYPHVEVAGKQIDKAQLLPDFTFTDIKQKSR